MRHPEYEPRLEQVRSKLKEYVAAVSGRAITHLKPNRPGGAPILSINPAASGTYDGIWADDFYVSIKAGGLFTVEELTILAEFLTDSVTGLRWFPDMVASDGMPFFAFGGEYQMTGVTESMSVLASFIRLLDLFEARGVKLPKKERWLAVFRRSLAELEFSCGLLYSNINIPHIAYGFHDVVAITGFELMSSVYTCKALPLACKLFKGMAPDEEIADWQSRADGIRDNLWRLFDAESGSFYAGSYGCRQPDIFGSGLAAGISPEPVRRAVADYYMAHREDLFFDGMTCQTETVAGWQTLLLPVFAPGEYINGGYWPGGTAYTAPVLYEFYPEFAVTLLETLVEKLPGYKFCECIHHVTHDIKCPDYVMSVALNLLAVTAMLEGGQLFDTI